MVPQTRNLTMWQGSTWRANIQWDADENGTPKDLTDYVFRMQVRKKWADEDTLGAYVDIDSETKGGITLNEQGGNVSIIIDGDVIALMPKGGYVYDIEYEDAQGAPDKLYRGQVTVNPEATRG